MAVFSVANSTNAVTASLNAGGKVCPANGVVDNVVLTGAELLVVAATTGLAVFKDQETRLNRRKLSRRLKYTDSVTLP